MKCKICNCDAHKAFEIDKERIAEEPVVKTRNMVDYYICNNCGFLFLHTWTAIAMRIC